MLSYVDSGLLLTLLFSSLACKQLQVLSQLRKLLLISGGRWVQLKIPTLFANTLLLQLPSPCDPEFQYNYHHLFDMQTLHLLLSDQTTGSLDVLTDIGQ